MSYYIAKTVDYSFEEAIEKTTEVLKEVGFGIVTTINMQAKLKEAIDKEIKPYVILGACNPGYASQVIEKEPHIGLMLPCNLIVRQTESNKIEVSVINAYEAMKSVNNSELEPVAKEVMVKLEQALSSL
jgi:uncharacterized protein (DUF302 family)